MQPSDPVIVMMMVVIIMITYVREKISFLSYNLGTSQLGILGISPNCQLKIMPTHCQDQAEPWGQPLLLNDVFHGQVSQSPSICFSFLLLPTKWKLTRPLFLAGQLADSHHCPQTEEAPLKSPHKERERCVI